MITEDYVSDETAKFLKEKGFQLPVKNYYSLYTEDVKHNLQKKYGAKKNWNSFALTVSRPSQSLVMKWLREVHKLYMYTAFAEMEEVWFSRIYNKDKHQKDLDNFNTYEEACEAAIKYCLENLI